MSLLTYLTLLSSFNNGNNSISSSSIVVHQAFRSYELSPNWVPVPPSNFVIVGYASRLHVVLGNVLLTEQVQYLPQYVGYYACAHRYYSIILLDIDDPSRARPTEAPFRLWHVGNIPGDRLSAGQTLVRYLPPRATRNGGVHRCVFLVYRQPDKLTFTEPPLLTTTPVGRMRFPRAEYEQRYNLTLIAGNFYQVAFGNTGCLQGNVPRTPRL